MSISVIAAYKCVVYPVSRLAVLDYFRKCFKIIPLIHFFSEINRKCCRINAVRRCDIQSYLVSFIFVSTNVCDDLQLYRSFLCSGQYFPGFVHFYNSGFRFLGNYITGNAAYFKHITAAKLCTYYEGHIIINHGTADRIKICTDYTFAVINGNFVFKYCNLAVEGDMGQKLSFSFSYRGYALSVIIEL